MYDLIVIGAGPAGLAAANRACRDGLEKVLVIERDSVPGGILNQCIHNGFGLHRFGEELTGPEYAGRFTDMLGTTVAELLTDAMVLSVSKDRRVTVVSPKSGFRVLEAKTIILAMGCRERTSGAIGIPGTRPSGVFTAGSAQRYVNIEGRMVGKRVLILGSGDIGLIMARRMTLEGAEVLACVEVLPYSGGLNRNIVQCLRDYDIPLYLSHTITEIRGKSRVEGAVVSRVDENRRPIPGTEMEFDCDTILLSVGLIPENELTRGAGIDIDPRTNGPVVFENMETSAPGIFACGNVVHVHDLVDFVSAESERAGSAAVRCARSCSIVSLRTLLCSPGEGVSYTVPQKIRLSNLEGKTDIFFRVRAVYPSADVVVKSGETVVARFKREYLAPGEMQNITVPKQLLDRAESDVLTVSVDPKGQGGDK